MHNAPCTVHTFQVEKWVGVRVPLQDRSEERKAGGNYHLSLELRFAMKSIWEMGVDFKKLSQNRITL